MSNLNLCQIIGRLGRDPDVRYAPSGSAVANFSVAVSESWKDKATGERKEATEWFKVVMFGKQAEVAGEHLKKGSLVYLAGKIKTRSYEKDGQTKYVTELHADDMRFLERRESGEASPETGHERQMRKAGQAPAPDVGGGGGGDFSDDIPFNKLPSGYSF